MSHRIAQLLGSDLRQMARDPMLAFYFLAPLLLLGAIKFGVPAAAELLLQWTDFELTRYQELILSTAMLLIPLILGVMAGFMVLDERDENLIGYFAVTPLTKRGYVGYRMTLPVLLTVVYCSLLFAVSGMLQAHLSAVLFTLLMLAMEAAMIALLMFCRQ